VRLWVSLDVHKLSIVAATLAPVAGKPEVCRIETTEKAVRRFIDRLGGPTGLAVCYEAGPGGFALWRLLTRLGVACDVVAGVLHAAAEIDERDLVDVVAVYRRGNELLYGNELQGPTPVEAAARNGGRHRGRTFADMEHRPGSWRTSRLSRPGWPSCPTCWRTCCAHACQRPMGRPAARSAGRMSHAVKTCRFCGTGLRSR
jgi:hypothetical protein